MATENAYYNAVAAAAAGNYKKLEGWREGHPTWQAVFEALAAGPSISLADPEKEWQKIGKLGIRLVLLDEAEYPPLLREIPHPPFGIYILGSLSVVPNPLSVAIVGTRRATPEGKSTAKQFARGLADAGFAIISGLAFGIDAAAHEGCLEADGKTIAVLAGGLDGVYPRSNEPLARKILAHGGALVSEYPIGQVPLEYRFLERNRLVSGLAQGILAIEVPEKSGALVTARFAVEQNRDVFVVPGSISHPNFKASHALIRQGAELVTKPEHIMEAYGVAAENKSEIARQNLSPEEMLILSALDSLHDALDVDKLADITKLETQVVNGTITVLVTKNFIKETGQGYIISQ